MKEIKAILNAYRQLEGTDTQAALATVVRVEGSSYRRTGARMLIMDNGLWVGGISGGCLEGDALKRARLAIAKSQPSLVRYDTTEDDAHQIGVGLGCNGVIDVLLTPLRADMALHPIQELRACTEAPRQTQLLLTITKLEGDVNGYAAGTTLRYDGPDSLIRLGQYFPAHQLVQLLDEAQKQLRSRPHELTLTDGRTLELFVEVLPPELHVVMLGHQYDVLPLAKVVKEAGWRATVVAQPGKVHPLVREKVDAVVEPDALESVEPDAYTAMILMAHDYKTDLRHLQKVLQTQVPYIGLLGPRVRSERMLNELRAEGVPLTDQQLARIFAPVGLDIGALSPEEIALSIAAEIRAVFSGRNGASLRHRTGTIHERD